MDASRKQTQAREESHTTMRHDDQDNMSVADKIKHNVKITKKLLKDSMRTKVKRPAVIDPDQGQNIIFVKGEDQRYTHYVSVEGGDNLHYFRKNGEVDLGPTSKPPQMMRKKKQFQADL